MSEVEFVPSHDHEVELPKTQIVFVVNASKNAKAPTHFALIDAGYPFTGCVHSLPVYVKDNVPTCSVPNNYGNPPIQAKRVSAYAMDADGENALGALDAAVRIAFYGWQKTKEPQPFVL